MNEYKPLFGLFVNTLELADAVLEDYLNYLDQIKSIEIEDRSEKSELDISRIYKKLNELAMGDGTKAVKSKIM
jgi:hypothetical protein